MARVNWGTEVNGWFVEDTGGRVLVAVREVSDAHGNRLAVAVSDETMIAFRAIGRPYKWATLDDFLDAACHDQYWSDTSVQEELARFRRGNGWEATPTGEELFGGQREALDIVKDGLAAMEKLSNNMG